MNLIGINKIPWGKVFCFWASFISSKYVIIFPPYPALRTYVSSKPPERKSESSKIPSSESCSILLPNSSSISLFLPILTVLVQVSIISYLNWNNTPNWFHNLSLLRCNDSRKYLLVSLPAVLPNSIPPLKLSQLSFKRWVICLDNFADWKCSQFSTIYTDKKYQLCSVAPRNSSWPANIPFQPVSFPTTPTHILCSRRSERPCREDKQVQLHVPTQNNS